MNGFYRPSLMALLLSVTCFAGQALADRPEPPDSVDLESINPQQSGSQPMLTGGVVAEANAKEWRSNLRVIAGGSSCTGTLVGQDTLLFAAHCIRNGGTVNLRIGGSQTVSGTCTHAPGYSPKDNEWLATSRDWALCKLTKTVRNVTFEVVNTDKAFITRAHVLLTGYGCTAQGATASDGKFRIGYTQITAMPDQKSNYIETKGEVAVCFGDSGGAVYFSSIHGSVVEGRRLVAVNSRGNISDTSYLSATATDDFIAFATDWASANNAQICGVTPGAQNCRS